MSQDLKAAARKLAPLGVKLEIKDGQAVMSGGVKDPGAKKIASSLANDNPAFRDDVELISRERDDAKAEIVTRAIGIPGVRTKWVANKMVIEGEVSDESEMERVLAIAKLYNPAVLSALKVRARKGAIGKGPMIELGLQVVEVKKSALKSLGISWAPGSLPRGNGDQGFAGIGTSLLGFVFNLLPKLKFLNEKGMVKVAESPTFVVKSGEAAELFVGQKLPYAQKDKVEFQEVGMRVEAVPVEVGGKIDVSIKVNVSSPSAHMRGAVEIGSFSTTALCSPEQSIVLARVSRASRTVTKNQMPDGIDTSSALFAFAIGRDKQSQNSEWLLFLTPRFVESGVAISEPIEKWQDLADEVLSDSPEKDGEKPASARKNQRGKYKS